MLVRKLPGLPLVLVREPPRELPGLEQPGMALGPVLRKVLPPLVLPPAMEERLPAGCDRPQLLSALREAGALRPGQISLGTSKG